MNSEFVVYSDGRTVPLGNIIQEVSLDIYQDDLHYAICENLADQYDLPAPLRYVLVNLLSLKSLRARAITALGWYLSQETQLIIEARVFNDVYIALESLCPANVVMKNIGPSNVPFITRRQVLPVLVKVVMHRLFRLVRRRPRKGRDILRAWVDVTEAMYPEILRSAEVRIYPFPFGIIRQFKFIMRCRSVGASWSLDGLPYSLIRSLGVLFTSKSRAIAISRLENNAYLLYAEEVLKWKPISIYTSDEYEVGNVSLYTKLSEQNVVSVNTAHGIGWYCPYVAYTEFVVFNMRQGEFYQQRHSLLTTTLRKTQNVKLPIEHESCRSSKKVAYVLVHQNFDDFNMPAEQCAQLRLGKLIRRASENNSVPYFVKLHPNTRPSKVDSVVNSLGADPLIKWSDLIGYRPVFILINSTAFFELIEVAPVLVFSSPSFRPSLYFNCCFNTISEENCCSALTDLIDLKNWDKAFNFQSVASAPCG